MDEFLNFITTNYRLIIDGVSIVVVIVFFILRKKPVVDVMRYISFVLPDAINDAEKTGLKGQEKLYAALRNVIDICKNAYNLTINYRDYPQILNMIEEILSTPQKKGVKNEKKAHD